MSEKEFDIIGHSLGIKTYHARTSEEKTDKVLPESFYRNYFQAGDGHSDYKALLKLEADGLMRGREQFGMPVFHVTDSGKAKFREEFSQRIQS